MDPIHHFQFYHIRQQDIEEALQTAELIQENTVSWGKRQAQHVIAQTGTVLVALGERMKASFPVEDEDCSTDLSVENC